MITLALVQGLTEFLPISSSAHLILVPTLLGWPDQGLAFDVAVHIGTLSAVVFYLRQEIMAVAQDWSRSVVTRRETGDSRLGWGIIVATLPAVIAGLLFNDLIETTLRSPLVIAMTTIVFGIMLWWADVQGTRKDNEHGLPWRVFIIVGCAQALALVPGTSRSGITITAALFLGLDRTAAARLSFLLSIPIILAAGSLKTLHLVQSATTVDWLAVSLGVVISAVSAYLCIHFFLKLLERLSMLPFVIYRLLLGIFLFATFS